MTDFKNAFGRAYNSFFGKSEAQNRISKNALKLIISDMCTLYQEFKKAHGLGALFFNPQAPEKSLYLTIPEIKNDIALAEEICDSATAEYLHKLIKVIDKNEDTSNAVISLVSPQGLYLFVLDLNETDERINKISDAASSL